MASESVSSAEQALIDRLEAKAPIPGSSPPKNIKAKSTPKKRATKQVKPEPKQEMEAPEENGKTPKANQKRSVPKVKKEDESGEDSATVDSDAGHTIEPTTPKTVPVRKRVPSAKKNTPVGDNGTPAAPRSKKRGNAEEIGDCNDTTPSKKQRTPTVTPKAARDKLPTSKSDLNTQDRLMFHMKEQGKTWTEITEAYSKITGLTYGKSTIASRYAKIVASFTEWKEGDIERMLYSYDIMEQEIKNDIAAYTKKAESEIWSKTAAYMEKYGADKYTGGAVEKAYQREKKNGFPHKDTIPAIMAPIHAANGLGHDAVVKGEDGEIEDGDVKEEEDDVYADASEV